MTNLLKLALSFSALTSIVHAEDTISAAYGAFEGASAHVVVYSQQGNIRTPAPGYLDFVFPSYATYTDHAMHQRIDNTSSIFTAMNFNAYPGYNVGATTALGHWTLQGRKVPLVATLPARGPGHLRVFGFDGQEKCGTFVFSPQYSMRFSFTFAKLKSTNIQLVVAPKEGSAHMKVYDVIPVGGGLTPNCQLALLDETFVFAPPYQGGVNLTVVDMDKNGGQEIYVVPAAPGAGRSVKGYGLNWANKLQQIRDQVLYIAGTDRYLAQKDLTPFETYPGGMEIASMITGEGNPRLIFGVHKYKHLTSYQDLYYVEKGIHIIYRPATEIYYLEPSGLLKLFEGKINSGYHSAFGDYFSTTQYLPSLTPRFDLIGNLFTRPNQDKYTAGLVTCYGDKLNPLIHYASGLVSPPRSGASTEYLQNYEPTHSFQFMPIRALYGYYTGNPYNNSINPLTYDDTLIYALRPETEIFRKKPYGNVPVRYNQSCMSY